jgi:glycerol uptake facilitator-like aquaporin
MTLGKRSAAEFFGTFWLVFGGCGSAVLAAAFPGLGIGFAGVALAFGLTVLTMAFAIGHISGCHLNPAVTAGLVAGKRFPAGEFLPYVIAQVLGAFAAASVLFVIASGKAGFSLAGGFASNGYAEHSPGGYSLLACFVAEVVLTMFFLPTIRLRSPPPLWVHKSGRRRLTTRNMFMFLPRVVRNWASLKREPPSCASTATSAYRSSRPRSPSPNFPKKTLRWIAVCVQTSPPTSSLARFGSLCPPPVLCSSRRFSWGRF